MASSTTSQSPSTFPRYLSTINVSNFVSSKLSGDRQSNNYSSWKKQMLCLIESQDLLRFIDLKIPPPPQNAADDHVIWRTDRLVQGWILGALGDDVLKHMGDDISTARDVWLRLDKIFGDPIQVQQEQSNKEASSSRIRDLMEYVPLHKAALRGDWEAARRIFDPDPDAISVVLNPGGITPLHAAVGTGKAAIHFVQKIVEMMPNDEAIGRRDCFGDNALHYAAAVGNIGAATILVNRMPGLLYVSNTYNDFPVQKAALRAQKRMVEYLISVTNEQTPYEGTAGLKLLRALINAEFFDVALDLVEKYPHLAKLRYSNGNSPLSYLAENKYVISSERRFSFWERLTTLSGPTTEKHMMTNQQARSLVKCLCKHMESMSFKEAELMSNHAVAIAARVGNRYVVEMVIEAFPIAIYSKHRVSGQYIFHLAVENRSEDVFNLIYQMSYYKYIFSGLRDNQKNNWLHAAGKLAPRHKLNEISGAALQMQRELQWYKEIEKFVRPDFKKKANAAGKSPWTVFTEEHKELKEEGEKWMKDTSASCSIAAALIVTVMFASAITVPGGNEGSTGYPMFSTDVAFIIFAVSDAISLFTSTTSLLIFLTILTSRYAEEDFLHVLPKRLIIGLGTLFLSIIFMMVAFGVTIYLVFGRENAWVLFPVAALACFPVTSFVLLQYPLLVDLIASTYGRRIFGKQSDRPFY